MSRNLNPVFLRVGINQLWRYKFMPDTTGSNYWNSYSHQFMSYLYLYRKLEIFLTNKFYLKIAQFNILRIKWANKIVLRITVCFFQMEKKLKKSKKQFYQKLYEKAFKKYFILSKNLQLLKFFTVYKSWSKHLKESKKFSNQKVVKANAVKKKLTISRSGVI